MRQPSRIDAHQHFWQIARGDYDWMTDDVAAIRRDYLPPDLAPVPDRHGISATVLVQAAATVAETRFMISLAEKTSFIKGIVGWVDLEVPDLEPVLDQLAAASGFKGIRPMLQDIEDTDWILQPRVVDHLHLVADRGLRLDVLITPRHLDVLETVARQVPHLPIVIDQCAKPVIAGGADPGEHWRRGMARLARLPNTYCKISGLANEAGTGWCADWLAPVVDHLIAVFGPDRLMWGSDWPVLDLAGTYADWRTASDLLLGQLPDHAQARIYGGTAAEFYGLDCAA